MWLTTNWVKTGPTGGLVTAVLSNVVVEGVVLVTEVTAATLVIEAVVEVFLVGAVGTTLEPD